MKKLALILLSGLLLLTGCAAGGQTAAAPQTPDRYQQIDQERAKEMMALDDGHVIVDVRRLDEYESGHIPGAICIPNESIEAERPEELPNLEQILLVYCRSGRRSKEAAEKLFGMGYKNVYEFGGIIDWTGEVALGQTLALTVEANPSTGYSWAAAQEGELFDVQSWCVSEQHAEPVSGAGGWQTFLLTPRAPGTATVSFTYSRPWEPSDADPQFAFTLEVAEDLTITVTGDGSEQAAELGYPVTVRVY